MNTHTTQTTHCFTLQQLRAATQAGGVAGVSLKAQGSGFFIQIQLRTGQNAVLVTARSRSPRMFKNPAQAFGVLKRVGIVTGSFDVTHYSPEQQQTDNDTKKKEKAEKSDDGDDGLDAKTSKELYQMLKEAGLTKGRKLSKKSEMIEALRESGAGADADDEDEGEDEDFDEVDENEETEENPYEGKTAMALFKECKKRKLKVAPKKPAKFYVEALLKDDAEKVENVDEDEDDWGDDEEVEETKKDKVNKGKNKSKEKVEDDEDDDEDWDI